MFYVLCFMPVGKLQSAPHQQGYPCKCMNVFTIKNQNRIKAPGVYKVDTTDRYYSSRLFGYDYHYITEKSRLYVTRSHTFIIYIYQFCMHNRV
jgi:hypothetical protein